MISKWHAAAKVFFLFAVMVFVTWSCSGLKKEDSTKAKSPNIIYILVDDMGFSDLGCFGAEIETPVLDQLAEEGLRFTSFYNSARCCPSRAALLTGLYPHAAGMGRMVSAADATPVPGAYQGYLSRESKTIAEVLKEAGYRSYMSGKWHVGEAREHWPTKRGFDRYFGLISGASSFYELLKTDRNRKMALDHDDFVPEGDDFYMTHAFTDYALDFLEEHVKDHSEKPFFLYLAYTAPHWPIHAPEPDVQKYLGKYMKGWDELRKERFDKMKALGIIDERYELSPRTDGILPWAEVDDDEKVTWDRKMAVYAAMIDIMDRDIGRLVDYLKRNNEYENTLIVFISDNGGCEENVDGRKLNDPTVPIGARGSFVAYDEPWANASNTPFRKYKRYIHEGGVLTPAIVHWPAGITNKGALVRQPVHIVDLMPTAIDLAAHEGFTGRFGDLPGTSIAPWFRNTKQLDERTFYWEHFGNRAIRRGDWKLVMERSLGEWELYNLALDPVELDNLVSKEEDIAFELEQQWQIWAEEIGVFEIN